MRQNRFRLRRAAEHPEQSEGQARGQGGGQRRLRQHDGYGDPEHPRFKTGNTHFHTGDTRIDARIEARFKEAETRIEVGLRGQASTDGASSFRVSFRLLFLDASLLERPRIGERIEFRVCIDDGHTTTITRRGDSGKRACRQLSLTCDLSGVGTRRSVRIIPLSFRGRLGDGQGLRRRGGVSPGADRPPLPSPPRALRGLLRIVDHS